MEHGYRCLYHTHAHTHTDTHRHIASVAVAATANVNRLGTHFDTRTFQTGAPKVMWHGEAGGKARPAGDV